MARKKKTFSYIFDDGPVMLDTSTTVKCNVTGEEVVFYHKFLVKLIEDKYKNQWLYFLKKFAKRGAQKDRVDIHADPAIDNDNYKLNAYSDYLIAAYTVLEKSPKDPLNTELCIKQTRERSHLTDCFRRHFNRDISCYVKEQP